MQERVELVSPSGWDTLSDLVSAQTLQGRAVPPAQESTYLKWLQGGAWPPPKTSPRPIRLLPAQVANLSRAIHLQLCSVRIPQAKQNALQAITLLARNHTPELVAAFLDFSIPLDRCPDHRPPCPTATPPSSPGGGDISPPPRAGSHIAAHLSCTSWGRLSGGTAHRSFCRL